MKKILPTILIVLIIEAVALVIFIFSGAYNVSTSNHDNGFINWWLATGATRAVKHHASSITVPPLDDPALVQEGFMHYDNMCVECHGAPGKEPEEIAKGLWPTAPNLSRTAGDWTSAQLFWITKNGIKFSAMPGWGATHDDHKIWSMVAFVQKLPKMSAADYQQMSTNMSESANSGEHHEDHESAKPAEHPDEQKAGSPAPHPVQPTDQSQQQTNHNH